MRARKNSADRKAEIVNVTLELVAELGPERVTTQAVATRVGITQAGVFRHFPAKRDLWLAVADWVVIEAERRWAVALESKDGPLAGIKAVIIAQMKFIQETPAVPSLIFSRELHTQNEELRQAFHAMAKNFHGLLVSLVKQAQAKGELTDDIRPGDIASLLLILPPGIATRWSLSGQTFNMAKEGAQLLRVLLNSLLKAECQSHGDVHNHD